MDFNLQEDLNALLDLLPENIRKALEEEDKQDSLIEVVMDLGRFPAARYPEGELLLTEEEVTQEQIDHVVEGIAQFDDDNRAGIARTLHRISALKNRQGKVVGLTCRVGRVVHGTSDIISDIIEEGKSLLLLGRPGVGKTTLAKALAQSIDGSFSRIQFTPDLLPSDVTGSSLFNQKSQEFEFRPGPIFHQIVLADEINRATPRTQSSLLEAMQEGQVTTDGITRPLPNPFMTIATQNPIELEGTFPLPEAQLDRFLLQIELGYPSFDEEDEILERYQKLDPLTQTTAVVDGQTIVD